MHFDEARQRFDQLTTRWRQGQITQEQYVASVNELRVQDPSGTWWQLDPASGGWIFWNGSQWVPGAPPTAAVPGHRREPPRTSPVPADGKKIMDMKTFREISRTQPMSQRPQRWFDLFSILAGVVVAVLWFLYGSIRAGTEGFDLITPILLIGIPVMLALYRRRIDEILVSVQPFRRRIPRPLLIGLGVAVPFLTAFILYNVFNISQYPLLHWNIIAGTLLCYVIVRDPALAPEGSGGTGMNGRLPALIILVCCLCVTSVMADDCERDPFNAQDCLRTAGYAQLLAGVVSATSGIFVNFPSFIQAVQPSGGRAGSHEVHDWKQQNEDEFQRFVDKGREGYHYDKDQDAWIKDSELVNLERQRTQQLAELNELRREHDQRVKNQQKNIFNTAAGALAPFRGSDIDNAAQTLKEEQQKLAEENARIKEMEGEIQNLDNEISFQRTRQQFHQQK